MNTKSNFLTGLVFGIAISFAGFLFIAANADSGNSNAAPETLEGTSVQVHETLGGLISSEEAQSLINSYKTDFIDAYECLPPNTTVGGFIGKENLQQLTSSMGQEDQYVKFSFYLEQDPASGDKKIGIIFIPNENATNVLRTGPGSFCPTLCDTPR